jgi:Asp/Glu/hydantoin racemase
MNKKIVAIYTGAALVEPGKRAMEEILPDVETVSVLDDSLIADVIKNGGMTHGVLRRLYAYVESAVAMGATVILETCSSVGESVDLLQPFCEVPIVRIDRPMIEDAVAQASRIGVLATLSTTLDPTMRLVEEVAEAAGRSVTMANGLADGAFQALTNGDAQTHDRMLLEKAKDIADSCDAIVLAQGSMARMQEQIQDATGTKVYASLRRGIEGLKKYL